MARILYTICGVGVGHAQRSAEIISELKKANEIMIASYGSAFDLLSCRFSNSAKLKWFELVFENGRYRKGKTFFRNLRLVPSVAKHNAISLYRLARRFKPDAIISDFDPNGVYLGKILGIPVTTISSMHLMNYAKPEMDFREKMNYYITDKPVLEAFNPSSNFIIPSFWVPEFERENEYCFPPILRSVYGQLLEKGIEEKSGQFTVYFHNGFLGEIVPLLRSFPEKRFFIYGSESEKKSGNVQFRRFSDEQFSRDLLASEGVISHGGMSTLGECALLRKPCLTISSKEFFERYYNAWLFGREGFGRYSERADKTVLENFFDGLPKHRKALKKANLKAGNGKILEKISELIGKKYS
ncbi:MAG: glycosyltransferase family protein [archaeon]